MQVHQILRWKDSDKIVTLAPGASVAEAAELLSVCRIGAVVVSPDGKQVSGIISERDIVRELGKRGPACMSDKIDDLMTTQIVTCKRNDLAEEVLRQMTGGRFRHMPVVEDGAMVGLISIGDVVKARLSELSMEKEALEDMIKGH